ncbi:hypothetical protein JK359_30630 [Streptomyces actinomycinicus]|uniref:Uncharacterized protein n=1 Tax=Streptomyces actinomycinicus TaxID=1695166 RepID=A0A937EQP7_9ACTN|nr:hypothetical protein [Streptomyces actinomycinicus]MBL1086269.1 hypothetical protein [Streptomyces actinomycinicus]
MPSTALTAALADIDTVFNGFASPRETPCPQCHVDEETAYLRTPYVPVPLKVVQFYLYEVPDHFDDHEASMRRLLPPAARALAEGTLDVIGHLAIGLARVDWRSWPPRQSAALDVFLHAWWQDVLATTDPPYAVEDVFDTCATIARSVAPFLDSWCDGPAADAHLVACADSWLYDLLSDRSPFPWWYDEEAGTAELRTWLSGPGAARLRALGEHDLAIRCELLALPEDELWRHPYWSGASAGD